MDIKDLKKLKSPDFIKVPGMPKHMKLIEEEDFNEDRNSHLLDLCGYGGGSGGNFPEDFVTPAKWLFYDVASLQRVKIHVMRHHPFPHYYITMSCTSNAALNKEGNYMCPWNRDEYGMGDGFGSGRVNTKEEIMPAVIKEAKENFKPIYRYLFIIEDWAEKWFYKEGD